MSTSSLQGLRVLGSQHENVGVTFVYHQGLGMVTAAVAALSVDHGVCRGPSRAAFDVPPKNHAWQGQGKGFPWTPVLGASIDDLLLNTSRTFPALGAWREIWIPKQLIGAMEDKPGWSKNTPLPQIISQVWLLRASCSYLAGTPCSLGSMQNSDAENWLVPCW